jgi:UDP-N-acetylmuramoyl-L-alanyl-D-glutamate--2,6-diaminopimelate ligase
VQDLVFGCGGDRDTGKRIPVGSIAGRLCDHVIITNDNPRSEDPEAILDRVEQGVRPTGTTLMTGLLTAAKPSPSP